MPRTETNRGAGKTKSFDAEGAEKSVLATKNTKETNVGVGAGERGSVRAAQRVMPRAETQRRREGFSGGG